MSQFSEYDDHICRLTRNNINGSAPKKKPKKANDSLKPLKIKQVDKWKPKIKNKYISNSGKKMSWRILVNKKKKNQRQLKPGCFLWKIKKVIQILRESKMTGKRKKRN